jgi:flagellar biosynthesis/type III secretory pathway protein FliH
MPSQLHEVLLLLFRNRPELAPELLRDAMHMDLPRYTRVRIDCAELNEVQPTEYRADLVVLLLDEIPVLGIVVEAQLAADPRKRFVWPVYVTSLRARLKCPVCLLVVTAHESVARWAAQPVDLGGGNRFVPLVLRPSGVPEITEEAQARADPELAVLSAMAHGRDADTAKSVQIALAAQLASEGLDEDRRTLYFDLVLASLSEAVRRELQAMDPAKYEYQSEFARRYFAQGIAQGIEQGIEKGIEQGIEQGIEKGMALGATEGRAALVLRLLTVRFGPLDGDIQTRVHQASIDELDAIGERLLSAGSAHEAVLPLRNQS